MTTVRMIQAYPPGYWTHKYVISPTAKSQRALWEHMGVSEDAVYTATSLADLREAMTALLTQVKADFTAHKGDLAYRAAWTKARRGQPLTAKEERMLDQNDNAPPSGPPTKRPVAIVLVDDFMGLRAIDTHSWTSTVVRHRHLAGGAGISIVHLVQTLKSSVSRAIRQCTTLWMLWGTHDHEQLKEISTEVAGHVKRDLFFALFNDATSRSRHDFLGINLGAPKGRVFSRNFEAFYDV
jgi:hypothetical protein